MLEDIHELRHDGFDATLLGLDDQTATRQELEENEDYANIAYLWCHALRFQRVKKSPEQLLEALIAELGEAMLETVAEDDGIVVEVQGWEQQGDTGDVDHELRLPVVVRDHGINAERGASIS